MVLYIIFGIIMFGVLVMIHELGHFFTARAFGVAINEFSIGMGPKLFSKTGKTGTLYSLRALPIGGYVSMVGEDDDGNGDEAAFCSKPAWQRLIIIAAGAIMNIILGFIIMGLIVSFGGDIYSTKIERFNIVDENNEFIETNDFRGLEVGDEVLKVGSRLIFVRSDLVYEVMNIGSKPVDVTVKRNGETLVLSDFEFPTTTQEGIVFGNAGFISMTRLAKTPLEVIRQSVFQSVSVIRVIWSSLINTVRGKYGSQAVSGPVGVVSEIQETAQYGPSALFYLMMIISMNVGIFNLLPLPALDGGRLFFILIEIIRRKPINPKYEGYVHLAGMVILLSLMVLITFNDITKLIG